MHRRPILATGEIYHVFIRSIERKTVFPSASDFIRMQYAMRYFQAEKISTPFWRLLREPEYQNGRFHAAWNECIRGRRLAVQYLAYCLMPTHLHFVVKQLIAGGITTLMFRLLNSWSRFFNARSHRKGPLWESRFKTVRVQSDEQLLHLTRYVHLNPVTAGLVERPEDWPASSYREYVDTEKPGENFCDFAKVVSLPPKPYSLFVANRIAFQRDLGMIKKLLFETRTRGRVHRKSD